MKTNKRLKRWIALGLAALLAVPSNGTFFPREVQAKGKIREISDAREAAEMTADIWQDDYFLEVTVDPKKDVVTIDGETTTLEEQFPEEAKTWVEKQQEINNAEAEAETERLIKKAEEEAKKAEAEAEKMAREKAEKEAEAKREAAREADAGESEDPAAEGDHEAAPEESPAEPAEEKEEPSDSPRENGPEVSVSVEMPDPVEPETAVYSEEEILTSAASVEEFFEDSVYETKKHKNGTVTVTAPFQTMRIIVFAGSLKETYGAAQVLHYGDFGQYILQFDSQEAARDAYEKLKKKYGEKCFPDVILSAGEMLSDFADSQAEEAMKNGDIELSGSSSAAKTRSWGFDEDHMGLVNLKRLNLGAVCPKVKVAVIDTGITASHAMFSGRLSSDGYNFTTKDSARSLSDEFGHGTHVAGIIADGTTDNVEILPLKIMMKVDNKEVTQLSWVIEAFEYAITQNADVINFSMEINNAANGSYLDDVLEEAYAKGIPVIAAAGNTADQDVGKTYPANLPVTIAVSALDRNNDFCGDFSCYGSKIDFCGPGRSISSAYGSGYTTMTGTSMATPHVSAAFAYLKMFYPGKSVEELKNIAIGYCLDLGDEGKDPYYGNGLIRLTDLILKNNFCSHSDHTILLPVPELSWESGITSGTATFTCNICGLSYDYIVSLPVTNLIGGKLKLSQEKYTYDGTKHQPTVTVTYDGETLVKGTDYTVTYTNYTEPGMATVTVLGKNRFCGKLVKDYPIYMKAPTLVSAGNEVDGMRLAWKSVYGADGYKIYRNNTLLTTLQSSSVVTYLDSSEKTNGKAYEYEIRAYKASKDVILYSGIALTRCFLKRPVITYAKNASKRAITVKWGKNVVASGYQVQYTTGKTTKTVTITKGTTLSRKITGLTKNKSYTIRVRTVMKGKKGTYYSAWSSAKTVKVKK